MKVLLLGAGKIGCKIANYLLPLTDYSDILVADVNQAALKNAKRLCGEHLQTYLLQGGADDRRRELEFLMSDKQAVISAMYHVHNPLVAEVALAAGASYFDLTEDVESTNKIIDVSYNAREGQVFMPQCGLAPGFVSMMGKHLFDKLDTVDSIHLRVGALPQNPENKLKYNLTWSTEGLINEYSNPCDAIIDHKATKVVPLDGVERFSIEGVEYEAFNTSGGLGTFASSVIGSVRELNYKTLRYPGHRDLMHFLLHDLKFNYRREELVDIFDTHLPATTQDVVVIYSTASGWKDGRYLHLTDIRRIYGVGAWSAIQCTTAASVCAVLDLLYHRKIGGTGLLRQEDVPLEAFLSNRFGRVYAGEK